VDSGEWVLPLFFFPPGLSSPPFFFSFGRIGCREENSWIWLLFSFAFFLFFSSPCENGGEKGKESSRTRGLVLLFPLPFFFSESFPFFPPSSPLWDHVIKNGKNGERRAVVAASSLSLPLFLFFFSPRFPSPSALLEEGGLERGEVTQGPSPPFSFFPSGFLLPPPSSSSVQPRWQVELETREGLVAVLFLFFLPLPFFVLLFSFPPAPGAQEKKD